MKDFKNSFKKVIIAETRGGVAGSNVSFIADGQIVRGKCLNNLKKGKCLAMLADDGNWYLAAEKTLQIDNKQIIQYRTHNPEKKKDKVAPFKVLFTVKTDTHLDFYVGGHIKTPIKIHQISLDVEIYNLYAVIQNKSKDKYGFDVHIKYETGSHEDYSLNIINIVNISGTNKSEFVLDENSSKYFMTNLQMTDFNDTYPRGGIIENGASYIYKDDSEDVLNNNRQLYLFYKNNLQVSSNISYVYNPWEFPLEPSFNGLTPPPNVGEISVVPVFDNSNFASQDDVYITNLNWQTEYYYLSREVSGGATGIDKQVKTQGQGYNFLITNDDYQEFISEVSDIVWQEPYPTTDAKFRLVRPGHWSAFISTQDENYINFSENNTSSEGTGSVFYEQEYRLYSNYSEDLLSFGDDKIKFSINTKDYVVQNLNINYKSIDLTDKDSYYVLDLDIDFPLPEALGEHIIQSKKNNLGIAFHKYEVFANFDNPGYETRIRRLSDSVDDTEKKIKIYKKKDDKYYCISGYLITSDEGGLWNSDFFITNEPDATYQLRNTYNYKIFVEQIEEIEYCFFASENGVYLISGDYSLSLFNDLLGVGNIFSYGYYREGKQFIDLARYDERDAAVFIASLKNDYNLIDCSYFIADIHWKLPSSYTSSIKRLRMRNYGDLPDFRASPGEIDPVPTKSFTAFNLNKFFLNTNFVENKIYVSQQQDKFKTSNTKNYVETWEIADDGYIKFKERKRYPILSLKHEEATIYSVSFHN